VTPKPKNLAEFEMPPQILEGLSRTASRKRFRSWAEETDSEGEESDDACMLYRDEMLFAPRSSSGDFEGEQEEPSLGQIKLPYDPVFKSELIEEEFPLSGFADATLKQEDGIISTTTNCSWMQEEYRGLGMKVAFLFFVCSCSRNNG